MDSRSSIRVEIDEELMPVVPEYLENRHSDCALIEELLDRDGMDEIRSLAHRMKGSGGSYGFDEISEIGLILEDAAQSSDRAVIEAAVARLKRYLEVVRVEYV